MVSSVDKREQVLTGGAHSNNIALLANTLVKLALLTSAKVHAIRVPSRLLLTREPLSQRLESLTIGLLALNLDLQVIRSLADRA